MSAGDGVDAGAGPDRAGDLPLVAGEHGWPGTARPRRVDRPSRRSRYGWAQKQPWRTPMPCSALSRAATSAWGTPSTVKVASGQRGRRRAGPRRWTPAMAASPRRSRWASSSSWSAMASQPMRAEVVDGGVEATAPITLGEPASSRSGGSVHRPRRGRRGRRRRRRRGTGRPRRSGPGPDQHAGAERGVHLVAAPGHEVGVGRQRPVGASWAASTSTGTPRSWAAAMMASIGGSQPVTLTAPGDGQQPGSRPASRAAATSSTVEGAVGPHSTKRRRHSRAQGSRLAWCSTTVVTTTSSGASRSR